MKKALVAEGIVIAALVVAIICILTVLPRERVKDELTYKTEELLNENSYFTDDEGADLPDDYSCDMYNSGDEYYAVLTPQNGEECTFVYCFQQYDGTLYYIGCEDDYSGGKKIGSDKLSVGDVHQPDYYSDNNLRVTQSLDYNAVCQSIIGNYAEGDVFSVYILNSFPWDKSHYLNSAGQIDVMLTDLEGNVFMTCCYFSAGGWQTVTPGYSFSETEHPVLVDKYKETAVYCGHNIDIVSSGDEDFVSADTLLSMTGEIINERNYLSVSDISTYAGGESEYRISVSGDSYTVSVTSADEGISSDFTFEFDGTNNIYYVGSDPISTGKIIYSGTFSVEDVHVPEYDKYSTSNTEEYKEQIAQSIADEQLAQSEYSLVTVTVLDGFEWDKSSLGYIPVLVNYDNEEFTVTAAYYSGGEWRLEKANYLSDYTENEEYAERCMKCKAAQAYASR